MDVCYRAVVCMPYRQASSALVSMSQRGARAHLFHTQQLNAKANQHTAWSLSSKLVALDSASECWGSSWSNEGCSPRACSGLQKGKTFSCSVSSFRHSSPSFRIRSADPSFFLSSKLALALQSSRMKSALSLNARSLDQTCSCVIHTTPFWQS
jgi:hypothetical protein